MTSPPESPFTPPLPASTSSETIGREQRPSRLPSLPVLRLHLDARIDLSRVPAAATALGVALLSAAVVVSAVNTRAHHHLDGSNFTMGLLATAALLGIAIAAGTSAPRGEERASLVSWPGSAGVVGLALMAGVGLDEHPGSYYLTGAVALVLAAGAYAVTKAPAFTLAAIAGAALLYGRGFDDLVDTGGGSAYGFVDGDKGTNTFMIIGAAIVGFVVVATAVCWVLLPATRVMNGIVIGGAGVAGLYQLFTFLALNRDLSAGSFGDESSTALVNDIWAVLGYSVGLAVFWLLCSMISGQVGFRVLALVVTVFAVPAAAYALAVHHPTWWEVVACAGGGTVLATVGLLELTIRPTAKETGISSRR
ncbi:MAG: hypothetical protein ACJ72E_00835 [Marmoricola sp.]